MHHQESLGSLSSDRTQEVPQRSVQMASFDHLSDWVDEFIGDMSNTAPNPSISVPLIQSLKRLNENLREDIKELRNTATSQDMSHILKKFENLWEEPKSKKARLDDDPAVDKLMNTVADFDAVLINAPKRFLQAFTYLIVFILIVNQQLVRDAYMEFKAALELLKDGEEGDDVTFVTRVEWFLDSVQWLYNATEDGNEQQHQQHHDGNLATLVNQGLQQSLDFIVHIVVYQRLREFHAASMIGKPDISMASLRIWESYDAAKRVILIRKVLDICKPFITKSFEELQERLFLLWD